MGEKLLIGPFNRGLRNDVTAFNIDNDSFPTLINAYQWRGRVKRKRGTSLLNRLRRFFDSTSVTYNPLGTTIILDGTSSGNLITGFGLDTISPNASIAAGFVSINDTTSGNIFTDPNADGILAGAPAGTGTINYATGAFTLTAGAAPGDVITANFNYYPILPVMGLKDLNLDGTQFPGNIAFDTVYSYNMVNAFPYPIYDVSFFKNPPTGTYVGYVAKTNWTPVTWNGEDYQQFWSTNYQQAFWATNGIQIPFIPSTANVGMQFVLITAVAIGAGGPPAIVTITTSVNHGLVIGDFVFINEIVGMTGINLQTGYVTAVPALNQITVEFPEATIAGAWVSGGIVQYLTNRIDNTIDCMRWYDGDPTDGFPDAPIPSSANGWVNFTPPLSFNDFSIAGLPPDIYYLVTARMVVPFKDRLLFFGPIVQNSSDNPIYLPDTVIYSQNGTPYYTASFTGDPTLANTTFLPILVPEEETAHPAAFFADIPGFGGVISAGVEQPIITVSSNEDVLIVGFNTIQTRFVYSGNDLIPFNFFLINSELGSSSTFSLINMDKGVITRGSRGFIITSQTETQRIDLEIPDEVFQIKLTDNGTERVTAQRDFINEWLYETYPSSRTDANRFPTFTLQYNYRDNSWAIFYETYTTYGLFRKQTGFTWQTVGTVYPTWDSWNDPWNAGTSSLLKPEVIAGNPQGFVVSRADGTNEANSLAIQGFSGNVVTSPDHSLNNEDFILISGCLGDVGDQVNGKIFSVFNVTNDTFELNPVIAAGSYLGLGVFKRIYRPYIQTKQFPTSWGIARKTRLGPQQYLFTKTPGGKIQLLIFLSQNDSSAYNEGPIVPEISDNNALIYSSNLFTAPESENLGLTPANVNLNLITGPQQQQIWHRMNTSLLGDTVQIGFTLSDEQIRELAISGTPAEITNATQADPCVITLDPDFEGVFDIGEMVLITDVEGMTQLNGNTYLIIDRTPATGPTETITIEVDATGFDAYTDGGLASPFGSPNAFAEIELHSMILDVNPSQLLA